MMRWLHGVWSWEPRAAASVCDPWPAPTKLLSRIFAIWTKAGVPVQASAGLVAIGKFQEKYNVILPADIVEYLLAANGTGDDTDAYITRFLPLDEIKPVDELLADCAYANDKERYAYPDCFVFVDVCMSCWFYAVKLTSDPAQAAPVFKVLGATYPPEMMAPSFRDFMLRYANDPDDIT